jgi:hypothetical protein
MKPSYSNKKHQITQRSTNGQEIHEKEFINHQGIAKATFRFCITPVTTAITKTQITSNAGEAMGEKEP